jgi:hypothetical protein
LATYHADVADVSQFKKTEVKMENLDLLILSGLVSAVFFAFSFTLLKAIRDQGNDNK